MNKYFLCTLGTSVANGLKELLWAKQKAPGSWDDADPAFEKPLAALVDGYLCDKGSFHEKSAEASVLRKAGAAPGDRVALLSTDTGLGRICGEATKRLLVSGFGFGEPDVELVRIPGLQVSDAQRLRCEGLPGFVKAVVARIKDNRSDYETFLCPVGGYKGVVPFLTVLGMAFRLPVLYTFEFIDSLVRLPPLPFSLDRDLYARAKDALREIGSRTDMPEGEFLAKVQGYSEDERDAFLAFVEPSSRPGFVTSGAFTEAFAPGFECESAPVSPKALEDLDILSHGQWYRTACRMVMGSQDPVMRSMWNHKKTLATDLQILKQGPTNVRVLGYESGGRFYVCRIFDHEDYDKTLDHRSCKRAGFPPESFREWSMPPEALPESVRDEESPFEATVRLVSDLERKLQETEVASARRAEELRNARDAAEKGLGKTQRKLEETRQKLQERQTEVDRLRAAVQKSQDRVRELEAGSSAEREAAVAEHARLKALLAEVEEARRKAEVAEAESARLKAILADGAEARAAAEAARAENERLESLLARGEEERRRAEDEHAARYEKALRQIDALRRRLHEVNTRLALAPEDSDEANRAAKELEEKKGEFADALRTLLMSDKTDVPRNPSDEERALRTELRKVRAQLVAKSGEADELEKENASLAAALRTANERLARETGGGFLARLRRFFRP